MIFNRSVPTNTVLPHITYDDVALAIAWLSKTFGFVEQYRYGNFDAPLGAQVRLGDAWVMLRAARPGSATPNRSGFGTQSLTVFVEDVEAHCRIAKAAGATIVEDLHETEYGELQYGVQDLCGHHWLFSRHVRDVTPDEWGAILARPFQKG